MTSGAHSSESEMLLLAHGELDAIRAQAIRAHLTVCPGCRARCERLQSTDAALRQAIAGFTVDSISTAERARRRLKFQMAARKSPAAFPWRATAAACVTVAALVVFTVTVSAENSKPRASLTPGEARPITTAEVCSVSSAEVVVENIPVETQRQVFEAYGIHSARPGEFEVDYLITPDLGGTSSVRNLWPQPYSARWNARKKDQLEERLHQLVCGGQLDLATAQREIAADWIAAYKRYLGSR